MSEDASHQTGVAINNKKLHKETYQPEPLPLSDVGSQSLHPDSIIANFKKFIKGTKVVDSNGNPKQVYHGTKSSFDAFDIKKSRGGNFGSGFYFAEDVRKVNNTIYNTPPTF